MKCCPWLLVLTAATTCALPAPAGILFNRQARTNPGERVPQLLATLRADQDERKREAAAQDLRDVDPSGFPEIIPALIDALHRDGSADVRLEALQTLGRIRPVSQQAGWALEEAVAKDASVRVRLQARSLLLQYRLSGYRVRGRPEATAAAPAGESREPLSPAAPPTAPTASLPPARRAGAVVVPRETPPPPLAQPLIVAPVPQPLPLMAPASPLLPSATPRLLTPPSAEFQGPDLTPPR